MKVISLVTTKKGSLEQNVANQIVTIVEISSLHAGQDLDLANIAIDI